MAREIELIQAVQRRLAEFIPALEMRIHFEDTSGRSVLRIELPGNAMVHYFIRDRRWWDEFIVISEGPFLVSPIPRQSPYRRSSDPMEIAIWIAADVGQYDILYAYPMSPPLTDIGDDARGAAWARIDAVSEFLVSTSKGEFPVSAACKAQAGRLFNLWMV